jgi:hypothetical protein
MFQTSFDVGIGGLFRMSLDLFGKTHEIMTILV